MGPPAIWFLSVLFSSSFILPLHSIPVPVPVPTPLTPPPDTHSTLNIPIQNFANLSLTSSFIQLSDDISEHNKIKFAVSAHENTVFLGCACSQSAYAYSRKSPEEPWEIQKSFTPLTPEENDFGQDVSVSVNIYQPTLRLALIGSPSYQNNTGAVYLYREISPGNWSLVTFLSPGSPGDRFGASVHLDKFGQFAVGAPFINSRGQVFVYTIRPNYSTNMITTLESQSNPTIGDIRTGCTLTGSDDIVNEVLIVGACPTFASLGTPPLHISCTHLAPPAAGVATVYVNLIMLTRTSSELAIPNPNQFFGRSDISLALSMRADGYDIVAWLVVGQPLDKDVGSVTVITLVALNGVLAFDGKLLTAMNGQSGDAYGSSVALVDNRTNLVLFVGAPGHDTTGSIFIYFLQTPEHFELEDSSKWIFVRVLRPSTIFDEYSIQRFGFRLSYDRSVLAIGATQQKDSVTTPLGVVMDMSMIEFPIPTPLPSFAPTVSTRTSDNHNANLGVESSTLYIFIPVGAVVLGMILSLSYFLFRHKFDISRTRSYEKNTIQFIQKKQTKQIHCEPDRQTNLEAGMESLKKARWVIHPSQLTIPVAPNLGSGGYGVVKRGIFRDGRRKYDVAVKILLDRHVNSEEFRRVLIREAALMVELRSPYIVEVYGLCDSKMLVLELMNYGSLYTLLETVEPSSFPLSLRIQLMIDSIRGIEYLHESDVIHADMKSLNILLCTEGGSLKAKISDFGLSRIVMGDTCESTNTNQISIRWAAPEMLQDRPKISKSIDIYAFGVVMWEILALKRPYAEMNLAPLIQRVTTGGREPMPAETPPLIGDLISLCWAQFPDQRPKAAYVRESLTSFQQTFDTVGESISEFASPL